MKKTVLLLLLLVLISLTVACTEEPVDSGEDTNDLIIDEDHISSNYTGKIDTIQINDYLDNFYIGGFEEEEIKLCYGTLSKREILGIDEVLSEMISKLNSNEEIVEWLETQDCVVNAYVNPWMLESGFFGYGPQDIFVLFAMDDGSFQKKVIDIQFEDFDYKQGFEFVDLVDSCNISTASCDDEDCSSIDELNICTGGLSNMDVYYLEMKLREVFPKFETVEMLTEWFLSQDCVSNVELSEKFDFDEFLLQNINVSFVLDDTTDFDVEKAFTVIAEPLYSCNYLSYFEYGNYFYPR
tara:strand:- start:158 stop:1045 length:888 start_codon:yes stop_codon:yes gene_type:complete